MSIKEAAVLAALPREGFVRQYVEYAKDCTDAPLVYHVGGAIACLTQTCPLDYQIREAGKITPNLFVLLVGPSTVSRKTQAVNIAKDLIEEALPGSLREEPGSEEGLVEAVRIQPRHLLTWGEFGSFLSKADNTYLTKMKTSLNNLYDCSPIGRALAKQQRGAVQNPRVSVFAGCAPGYLERHTEPVDWTDGFMARWLTFYAERERTFARAKDDLATRKLLIARLKGLAFGTAGRYLGFTAEADRRWEEWHASKTNLDPAALRQSHAAIARAPGLVLRMALLFAWDYGKARHGEWTIGLEELEPAIKFGEMHIESVINVTNRLAANKDMMNKRNVLDAISSEFPTPLGFITSQAQMLVKYVQPVLETLREEKSIRRVMVTDVGECYIKITKTDSVIETQSWGGRKVDAPSAKGVAAKPVIVGAELTDDDDLL